MLVTALSTWCNPDWLQKVYSSQCLLSQSTWLQVSRQKQTIYSLITWWLLKLPDKNLLTHLEVHTPNQPHQSGTSCRSSQIIGCSRYCQCNAHVMQVNCQMKLGNPSSSARFASQWKWQGRLPWIPIKSLTNEDKAELGQIMQKKRTRVSFREKRCHKKP